MAFKNPTVLELDTEVSAYVEKSLHKAALGDVLSELLSLLATPPAYTTLRVHTNKEDIEQVERTVGEELDRLRHGDNEDRRLSVYKHKNLPDVLFIPHIGPHAIEKTDIWVIVDLACGMAVLRGAHVFAQGIMAAHPAMQKGGEVSVYCDVHGKCRKGLTKLFDGRLDFVGNGMAQFNRHGLFAHENSPSGLGVEMTHPVYTAPPLSGFLPQTVFPQNLPSVVCGHVLDPQPGELILDMCAAPGGKTSHIGILMRNEGRLIAIDKSRIKISKIEENVSNAGVNIVEVYNYDSTKCVQDEADVFGSPPYPPRTFDRILVDAPCSALGQRPSLRNCMSMKEVASYPALQHKLLCSAVALLKVGGVLVYSTCTIPKQENEDQVARILNKFPELALVSQSPYLGSGGWKGSTLSGDQCCLLQRFTPWSDMKTLSVNSDTIGFFIAKFTKSS